MNAIDFMLAHPGRFTKADLRDAAAELRAEVNLLNKALQNASLTIPDPEGSPS